MRIGLYGGTFSPPHIGHVRAAKLFLEKMHLDILYVMPSGIAPHKQVDSGAAKEDRMEMAKLAFGEFASVSRWEIDREGKSYTVETLRYLKKKHPSDELYMLIGEDMLLSLDRWYLPEEIMSLAHIVSISRSEKALSQMIAKAEEYKERFSADVTVLSDEPVVISSTEVRNAVASGKDLLEYVPDSVAEYISINDLYANE